MSKTCVDSLSKSILDIVERFQLALMLVSIAMRNLIELSSSDLDLSGEGAFLLPSAFKAFRFVSGRNIIWPILSVCVFTSAVSTTLSSISVIVHVSLFSQYWRLSLLLTG